MKRRLPLLPAIVLIVFAFFGIAGQYVMPHDPNAMSLWDAYKPPFWQAEGTLTYPLGTDQMGRDILSRIVGGASISMQVGFVVVVVAGSIGAIMALLAGYLGGWVDVVIMRVVDVFLSMPTMLIAIVLAAVLGPSKNNLILVLIVVGWSGYTRVLRSEVLRIKKGEFINLAIVAGSSKLRIMLVHVLPNMVNTLIVVATLQLGLVIITEATLSFIGVGVPPPDPAWGSMLADGRAYISSAWWLAFWPGLAILLVVMSFNFLGDWLRMRLDPRFRQV
ncbi:MAG: ABC transporter permease [Rhizobiaceae bacterium]